MSLARLPITGSDANTWSEILNRHISQTHNATNGAFNTFDQFSGRPTNLTADDLGKTYLYSQTGNLHEWSGTTWKVLNESVINVKDYGAVGDGVTDDTVAIQKAVDVCPDNSIVISGGGGNMVSKIQLKSNITFENFLLITKPSASITDFYSPITIGNFYQPVLKQNIHINNVHVTGNRVVQTNFPYDSAENGGRHGFRLIGYCSNITIENSSATYCGSDGIILYSGTGTRYPGDTNNPMFTNIFINNCRFEYNRRHGGSIDSCDGVIFANCQFNYNGIDLNNGNTEGNIGDFVPVGNSFKKYGNGFDIEGYGNDTVNTNLTFKNCRFENNSSAGLLFTTPSDPRIAGFKLDKNIIIDSCVISKGTSPESVDPTMALFIAGPYPNWNFGTSRENVSITNCVINGQILIAATKNVNIEGGYFTNSTRTIKQDMGEIYYCNNVKVGSVNTDAVNRNFETQGLSDVKYAEYL